MSPNVSSTDSPLHPNLFSVNTSVTMDCFTTRPNSFIFIALNLSNILLLLPVCLLVVYLGLRRRRSTSAAATSHSDVFTYNMVAMELSNVSGCIVSWCGVYQGDPSVLTVGQRLIHFSWYGETVFHLLTCLERYLAVVHPVTYRSLRGQRGIRIRNVSIGCAWLICCVGVGGMSINTFVLVCLDIFFLVCCLVVISFCSVSVICILIRPKPGEQGGDGERVNQTKKRAAYTITAILGVLLSRIVGSMYLFVLYFILGHIDCKPLLVGIWFYIPSVLVLPLLFMQRAGISACCKN